jgi:hypothetical protein
MATENEKKAGIAVGAAAGGFILGWLLHGQKVEAAGLSDLTVSNIRADVAVVDFQVPFNVLWEVTNNGSEIADGEVFVQIENFQMDIPLDKLMPGETRTYSQSYMWRGENIGQTMRIMVLTKGAFSEIPVNPIG